MVACERATGLQARHQAAGEGVGDGFGQSIDVEIRVRWTQTAQWAVEQQGGQAVDDGPGRKCQRVELALDLAAGKARLDGVNQHGVRVAASFGGKPARVGRAQLGSTR